MNLCRACGQDFGSGNAFDEHRVGEHAYTLSEGLAMEPMREDGRRCLAGDELEQHGFVRNFYGRWSLARSMEFGQRMRQQEAVSAALSAPKRLRGDG